MPQDNNFTLHLKALYCYFVEENKYDDVYLKYNKQKIWPVDKRQQSIFMDTETELNVDVPNLDEGKEISIELWDWDMLSLDDLLGTFNLHIEAGGPFSTDMTLNLKETKKAKYTLIWYVD